jgi:hypothetical protein
MVVKCTTYSCKSGINVIKVHVSGVLFFFFYVWRTERSEAGLQRTAHPTNNLPTSFSYLKKLKNTAAASSNAATAAAAATAATTATATTTAAAAASPMVPA